jgi:creatinine amidohydrolase
VDAGELLPFAKGLFRSLLRIGFRNIHFFIHHQSESFPAGMPTDLAFKLGAQQAIFEFLEKERSEGWWGDSKMADYQAGKGETSLMMALCPETVDMKLRDPAQWYARSAATASPELGEKGVQMILEAMRRALRRSPS